MIINASISGYTVKIDSDDYERFVVSSDRKWVAYKQRDQQVYFVRTDCKHNIKKTEKLHRLICGCSHNDSKTVDHINGNTLDLSRENLRVCSRYENARNKVLQKNNFSGFKGVCYRKDRGIYQARIWLDGKNKHLGFFVDPASAHRAYCVAAEQHFGDFARME